MATTFKSIPIFLSGFGIITGYTCPEDRSAIIKQIMFANETVGEARIDVKWCDRNNVGLGTTAISSHTFYPIVISGGVSGFSTFNVLNEFVSIAENDFITYRTAETGRVNVIMTIIEQDITS